MFMNKVPNAHCNEWEHRNEVVTEAKVIACAGKWYVCVERNLGQCH